MPRIHLAGVEFDPITRAGLLARIETAIETRTRTLIANHNLHSAYLAQSAKEIGALSKRADIVYIDGMPLVLMARARGFAVDSSHRVTFLDYADELLARAAARGWRLFLLGGRPGVGERARAKIVAREPRVQMGVHHGYFEKSASGDAKVIAAINAFRPDLLFLGLGMPLQERWLLAHHLELEATVTMTVGAAFDYLAGEIASPPRWAGRTGLEWAFRLAHEPRRLGFRYLVEPWFVARAFLNEVRRGPER
jgi:N-acetylglucosaminyldiphosphoundecaprenol N-acetyl-beta-D-mannosaminyltransferase